MKLYVRALIVSTILGGGCPSWLWAQTHFAWQQEYHGNPQGLTYRLYFDVGPLLMGSVTCTGPLPTTPETYDCAGLAQEPTTWATVYLTAEDQTGESLPSNVITFALPIQSVPSAPKHFRKVQ